MKKRVLSILIICMGILAFGGISVSAEKYGDLSYYISDGKVEITCCDTTATEVTIPEMIEDCPVTSLHYQAFSCCTRLTSITIPDSVTSFGTYIFAGCTSLKKVNITDIGAWCNIDFGSDNTNPLYHGAELYLNDNLVTELCIPVGVISIKDYAFYGCTSLKSVTIPDSVASIGKNAFAGCTSLTNITIPNSVTSIDDQAFAGCTSLKSIIIPDGVTNIGQQAFDECTSLTSITIPDSVTKIDDYAFSNCPSLKRVNITDIGAWCNIDFDGQIANPLYCAENLYLNDELVIDLVIPQEVKKLKSNTFYNCKSLKSIRIHKNISTICCWAFSKCTNVEDIYIEKGLKSVLEFAFTGCPADNVYFSGSESDWDNIVIEMDNHCLSARDRIIFDAVIPKTYSFITNGGSAVSDIDGEILNCPLTTKDNCKFVGWYDNLEFSGESVTFPYSGEKTTLYAKWKPIEQIKTTLLTSTPNYDIYTAIPAHMSMESKMAFVCYYKNKLTRVEVRPYAGQSPLYFMENNVEEYDEVKIIVWRSFNDLKQGNDV